MKAKRFILIFIIGLIIAGCAPSPEAIQKAIEETQKASITNTPIFTETPTQTPMPTKTPKPTITLTPEPNYVLETGFCIMMVKESEIVGDPNNEPGCGVQERQPVFLGPFDQMTITVGGDISDRQTYCALFDLDHNFIMYDLDTIGTGKTICQP